MFLSLISILQLVSVTVLPGGRSNTKEQRAASCTVQCNSYLLAPHITVLAINEKTEGKRDQTRIKTLNYIQREKRATSQEHVICDGTV